MSRTLAMTVRKLIAPLANRVRLLVSRGVVHIVNDKLKLQGVQVELHEDELHDDVEHFQEYGFTSHVKPGKAEAVFLSVGGNRSAGIVICVVDRNFRPKDLAEGDVCLYTENGERVYLNFADDIVHLGAKDADDFLAKTTETKANDDALKADLDALRNVFSTWVPVATDGGAALKAAIASWLSAAPTMADPTTTKVKGT